MNKEERRHWLKAILEATQDDPKVDDDMRLAYAVMAVVVDDHNRFTEADIAAGLDNPQVVRAAQALLAKVDER
jgi:hypothetical protein